MAGTDLHTHSIASDGTLSPTELAEAAKREGLLAIALTDHDTILGVDEFKKACTRLGIEGVSGIEVSARYETEMHILGLYVDEKNPAFLRFVAQLRQWRLERNLRLLERIKELGFDITEEDMLCQKLYDGLASMGRVHVSNALIKKGYVKDKDEAFDKYLKKGRICSVSRQKPEPRDCIKEIHTAGGIAVLAHPFYITKDKDELYTLLKWLKEMGLDGVECWYSEYPEEYRDMCLEVCKELDLIPTGGSDFHGANKPEVPLGKACGGLEIPYELFENLKKFGKELI